MAVAVPFLIANTAAGLAAATAIGVSVGTLATVTAVAFQVTGVNDKINRAASKVFGEDLVNVANLAGMAYGAVNGGFGIEGVGPNAAVPAPGGVVADAPVTQAPAVTGVETPATSSTGNVFDKLDVGADAATSAAPVRTGDLSGAKPLEPLQPTVTPENTIGKNMLTNAQSGTDPQRMLADAAKSDVAVAQAAPTVQPTSAAGQSAAATNAAGKSATLAPKQSLAQLAARDATAANATSSVSDASVQGWLKKNLGGEKAMLGMIQGAATVYDSNNKRKAAIEAAREQRRHLYTGPTFRLTQG